MPIYMDRHDLPDITAEDVAKAHKQDLEIQDQFNCRALTYWFDKERSSAFCLIEAPNKESVVEMHNHSHGLIPGNIIEVDTQLVESFLGRINNPDAAKTGEKDFAKIKEPAFRTILVIALQNVTELKYRLGINDFYNLVRKFKSISEEVASKFSGQLIRGEEENWILSFPSTYNAVRCALYLNGSISTLETGDITENLQWVMGLSAGDPVTKQEDLFGEAIQLARRLCISGNNGDIIIASKVNKLYKKENLEDLSTRENIKALRPDQEQFLNNLMNVMDEIWNHAHLTNARLSKELGLSESQLYRKCSSVTGSTPSEFMNELRLNHAVRLLENNEGNISQVAFEVGFNNPSYFSKCFRKRFGFLPSDYRTVTQ